MKVLIRHFSYGDQSQVYSIVTEATMATVWRCFASLAQREFCIHVSLMLSSVIFVLGDIQLHYCILTLPFTLFMLALSIWLAHRIKAWRFHTDLKDIDANYNPSTRKGFWVAVLLEGDYRDTTTEFVRDNSHYAKAGQEGQIIGTIAIDIKSDPDRKEPPDSVAWLRRMAVAKSYRKRGIGVALVDVALAHCSEQKFRAVELITTEFHEAAKALYVGKGFSISNSFPKEFVFGLIPITMYRFRRSCTRNSSLEEP